MGTRSTTVFLEENGQEICALYRQMDGYPTGHGIELCEFLADIKIINGFNDKHKFNKNANGIGCLIAQVIAHFKTELEQFYVRPAREREWDIEYVYTVYLKEYPNCENKEVDVYVKIHDVSDDKDLFNDTAKNVLKQINEKEDN